jgi:alkanesulfonate monooxygenase SsuD/methylene tetrahydromethanopterin reductase-like flavin-dependent oxidoreductase (luciferase family)
MMRAAQPGNEPDRLERRCSSRRILRRRVIAKSLDGADRRRSRAWEREMKFGMMVFPHPVLASAQAKFAEERGFSHVWFADLPMVCADVYACMALAATATRKIKLGTSVAVAPMRAAPVTVNSIATINALAPGRVVLGFASGSFTRGQLGLPPIRFREFREHVRTIRSLLDRGEALYEADGKPTKIRYFNRDWGSIALSPPIPLYLGAAGPKAAALAGEFGEGLLAGATPSVEILGPLIAAVRDGARRVGRSMDDFFFSLEGPICILRSGEALDSERIVATAGPVVVLVLKFMAKSHVPAQALPPGLMAAHGKTLARLESDHCYGHNPIGWRGRSGRSRLSTGRRPCAISTQSRQSIWV